jgi:hypothetical protein
MKVTDNTKTVLIELTYREAESIWSDLQYARQNLSDSDSIDFDKKTIKLIDKLDEYCNT